MNSDLFYTISLSLIPNIGEVNARNLISFFGNAANVFKARKESLEKIDGIGRSKAAAIKKFSNFKRAEEEIAFIEKYNIEALCFSDRKYPQRLLNCYDAPLLLYHKGNTDLNQKRSIAVIGTRSNSAYGKEVAEKIIRDIASLNPVIVSGLAYGIDAIAHKAAMKNNLSTVGVLAHGLDIIYPSDHQLMARQMIKQGGLLTDFMSRTKPDKHNFPQRNRIVAGMTDATIVIETDIKGGSLITAELAVNYNRDVLAIPGRVTDKKSSGCNELIRQNKAALITSADDIIQILGWNETKAKKKTQKELFPDLNDDEQLILSVIREKSTTHIDELCLSSGLSSSKVASAILSLELNNIIESLPGKIYRVS